MGGYPEPQWQELGACIRVVFPSRPQLSPDESVRDVTAIEPVSEPVSEPVNERQRWFLDQLGQGVPVNAEGIVQRWGVSLATAKRDIAALRQRKVVEFSGAPKTGVYRLTANKEPAS